MLRAIRRAVVVASYACSGCGHIISGNPSCCPGCGIPLLHGNAAR